MTLARTATALGIAIGLGLWGPSVASAQKKPAAKAAAKKEAKADAPANDTIRAGEPDKKEGGAAKVERRGGVKVYRLEEIKVEGRIQKPNAFYVLQRSSLNYELESLKQQFVPNILKSVSQSPF
jgi:hypothetical protein